MREFNMSLTQFNNEYLMFGDEYIGEPWIDPYNPLNLPPNTVRVRTSDGLPPWICYAGNSDTPITSFETATLVPGTTDVYDVYKSGTSFELLLYDAPNVIEVLGANTTGITDMSNMFCNCRQLTSVALFDTSAVTNMASMFEGNRSLLAVPLFDTSNVTNMSKMLYWCDWALKSVPLFDTSKVTDMSYMLNHCVNIESGALALYLQASTQAVVPSTHLSTFTDCGSNTTTGAAELAQIPDDWK